ncbi:amidohydrolase [Kiloniella spongiae]|nr:amidohydrolase [Kiloniella spongiae]
MRNVNKIFMNGHIQTVDDHNSVVEAVGITGDRIIAVGDLTYVLERMPSDSEKNDLEGKTLIPAFIDPHGHFPDPGFIDLFRVDLASPPRGQCVCLKDAFRLIAEKVTQTPKGEWVMGAALDHTSLSEGRMPYKDELDAISTEHPIWVIHASGHCGTANSMALELQGINEDIQDILGGRFLRDRAGRLNGQIEGISAMGDMGDTHFLINSERFREGFNTCRDEYLSYGVTLAQNAWAPTALLEMFAEVAADGDPGIDLVVLPIAEIEPAFSTSGLGARWPDNPHVKLGPRKLFTDGSFQMRTAYLTEPFFTAQDGGEPDCGLPYVERDVLFSEIKKLHDMGYQIHTHSNGDAGSDMLLDALEAALEDNPRGDHRHTLIHGQVLRDDQLARMKKLGVTVSFFSAHIYFWGDKHYTDFLGPDRANRISPAGSAERAGVRYTIHNDASVTPTRPLHLMHCAVNRQTSSGRVLGGDQRISAISALRAHTIDAAWQVFQEKERGSIEPGKLADLAILTDDPIANADHLDKLSVVETIRRGKSVWKKTV